MKKICSFFVKRKEAIIGFIIGAIAVTLLDIAVTYFFIPIKSTGFGTELGILADADELNVYADDSLIYSTPDPFSILPLYKGTVVTSSLGRLKVTRAMLKELYTLEFLDDGKVISKIKVMTPRNPDNEDKFEDWRTLDGHYVMLCQKDYYFSFGQEFLDNLSEAIKST